MQARISVRLLTCTEETNSSCSLQYKVSATDVNIVFGLTWGVFLEPPASPAALEVVRTEGRSANIRWQPSASGEVAQYFVNFIEETGE
jgi:hypothetical protein